MQCRTCGAQLPPNAQSCMRCGTPVTNPIYASAADATALNPSAQRPLYAPQAQGGPMLQNSMPGFGSSPYQQQQSFPGTYGPPTQQQSGSGMYGPPPQQQRQSGSGMYGPPPQQQQQSGSGMYGPPPLRQQQSGSGMYGPPPQQQPYRQPGNYAQQQGLAGSSPFNQGGPGGPGNYAYGNNSTPPAFAPHGQAQAAARTNQGGFSSPAQGPTAPPAFAWSSSGKKKSPTLLIGIVLLVVIVIGVVYLTMQPAGISGLIGNNSIPSGNTINAHAAGIITDVQTADAVDPKTYSPTAGHATASFKINQPVYITFKLNPKAYSVDKQPAYLLVKFYADNKSVIKSEQPYGITRPIDAAYFEAQYYISTSQGVAEVYWCQKADCSDRELAQVAHFTVSN